MGKFQEYLQTKGNFSGSVLIAQRGEIVYQGSFGWANREQKIPNTPDTPFRIASVTKTITAVAILQLVEKGLLEIHQPLELYFPGLYQEVIRVIHLLCHTSGIPNYVNHKALVPWDQTHTPEEIVKRINHLRLGFAPGTKWEYSNTNYVLLGMLIEKLTGMSYHQYVTENILKPAGMTQAAFEPAPPAHLAKGYVRGKPGLELDPSLTFACGDLIATSGDLHRFDAALFQGRLLRRHSLTAMSIPEYNGRFISFGYGWFIKQLFGRKSLAHSGSHPGGFSAHIDKYLPDDITIIVLSNNVASHGLLSLNELGATYISRELAQLIFEQRLWFWEKAFY